MNKRLLQTSILTAIIIGACRAAAPTDAAPTLRPTPNPTATPTIIPTREPTEVAATSVAAIATEAAWNSPNTTIQLDVVPTNVRIDDDTIHQYRRYLLFDSIRPIYKPLFVLASDAPLHADEFVMGVIVNDTARAYPISILRQHEMVNDEVGGLPILVTW